MVTQARVSDHRPVEFRKRAVEGATVLVGECRLAELLHRPRRAGAAFEPLRGCQQPREPLPAAGMRVPVALDQPLVGRHLDGEFVVAPGESGTSDYRPLFRVLRDEGYDGLLTVEATLKDLRRDGPRVVKFIKDQWNTC